MGVISRNFSGSSCHIDHFHLDEGDKKRIEGDVSITMLLQNKEGKV